MSADVLFVTVNYHTEKEIEALIASLTRQSLAWELQILDNGSTPAGQECLEHAVAAHPAVSRHDSGANLGYFGAVNAFLRYAKARPGTDGPPEWLIVTNPDVVLADDFLVELTRTSAEVIAPRLLDADTGRDLNPFMEHRPSRAYTRSRRLIFANHFTAQLWILASWVAATRTRRRPAMARTQTQRPIYAGHGAVLAFHRSYFTRGGSLDHEPFLFGEEITVAENVRSLGGRLVYAPSVVATHTGHVTTGVRRSRQLLSYQRDSARYIEQLVASRS